SAAVDASAITLSGLCLVHCLALPLAASSLAVAGALAEMEWLHRGFVVAAVPLTLFAIFRGQGQPGQLGFSLVAGLGLGLLVAGAFVEALHDYETPLTVVGAILLASAHAWRWHMHGRTDSHK
ncbi:MAG: MerC domain-containing protein, partial [Pseudomonadota bacterium]